MIYIVDDNKCVLRGFQLLLGTEGLETTICDSAEEFIRFWDQDENDILILDMHMHGMNGCNLLEYLKKKNMHLPVIIVTGYDNPEDRKCSKNYGTLAYLLKPVESEVLLNLIKQVSKGNLC